MDQVTVVHRDDRCLVERTGLHEREFIDTFRITTATEAPVPRNGSVHVLNLVEGAEARITSPKNAFPPFALHYAETCILPQGAGDYRLEAPHGGQIRAIVACVRD